MRILLIYHFFHPDTVVSARLFSELSEDLTKAGHQVTAYTCNRLIRSKEKIADQEEWNGVTIRRFSRPDFSQGSNFGRLFNSAILQLKWLNAFRRDRKSFDAVIVGTDPQFSYLMFPWMRFFSRRVKLIHWVFDLYPEAILVNSPRWMMLLASITKPFARFSYRFVNTMVDIGSCMRERLQKYHFPAQCATLTPWALAEPEDIPAADPEIREKLFGSAKIGILYSGTVGYAHDLAPFIGLARRCRREGLDVGFCFAGYGNCYKEQTAQLTPEDTNIRLAGFASEEELEKRLASADIHLVSLRPGWEGVVVPSKFFGSLAIGRPVIFSGAGSSTVAKWCGEYGIGNMLSDDTFAFLKSLLDDPETLKQLRQQAFRVYREHFSRLSVTQGWIKLLVTEKRKQ